MQGALAICVPEDVQGPVAVLVQNFLSPTRALIVPLVVVLYRFIQGVRWVGLDIVRDVQSQSDVWAVQIALQSSQCRNTTFMVTCKGLILLFLRENRGVRHPQ